jgi:hypothetical protein
MQINKSLRKLAVALLLAAGGSSLLPSGKPEGGKAVPAAAPPQQKASTADDTHKAQEIDALAAARLRAGGNDWQKAAKAAEDFNASSAAVKKLVKHQALGPLRQDIGHAAALGAIEKFVNGEEAALDPKLIRQAEKAAIPPKAKSKPKPQSEPDKNYFP